MKLRNTRFGKVPVSVLSTFLATLLVATNLFGSGSAVGAGSSPNNDYSDSQKYRNDSLIVKLKDTAQLEIDQSSNFKPKTTKSQAKASNLNKVLNDAGKQKLEKLVGQSSEPETAYSKKLASNLDDYFVVKVKPSDNIQALVGKIALLDSVETVYPQSKPAPAPTVNNYTSLQKYLNASPYGIDSAYAKTIPGGNGSAVRVIDLEYSWNASHEDLAKAVGSNLNNGTPADPFNDSNHGTAVLGEIVATDNSTGVTGAVSGAALSRVNTYNQERGWDIVGALQTAATRAVPGDVVLIEQQTWAPSSVGGYAPVEWEPAIYDAIKALTDSGINVVQAAANSGHNLDDTAVWGTTFPMGKVSSGSVIAGAGSACAAPLNARLYFSNYGSRVELQGHGECVTTAGYGALEAGTTPNGAYTSNFNGTSSAAPIVASAIASLSSAYKTLNPGKLLTPAQIRSTLIQTGTLQNTSAGTLSGNIGPLPNLNRALGTLTSPTDTTAPTASVLSGGLQNGKPKLTWTASKDNVAVKEYWVYRNGILYAKTTSLTYTDTNVARKTKYTYYIQAVDTSNNKSVASNLVVLTTK